MSGLNIYLDQPWSSKVPPKRKVDIDAEHVDITSAETTDKVAADKVRAAQTAAEKVEAEARIAAEVKLRADKTAAEVRANEAAVAKEVRATEVANAAAARRLEWWKTIMLPVMLALISGAVVAIPSAITAVSQIAELREIKQTGKDTHALVNSRMTAQLKISAAALRAVARITMNQDDEAAADLAESLLAEQEAAQKKLENGKSEGRRALNQNHIGG